MKILRGGMILKKDGNNFSLQDGKKGFVLKEVKLQLTKKELSDILKKNNVPFKKSDKKEDLEQKVSKIDYSNSSIARLKPVSQPLPQPKPVPPPRPVPPRPVPPLPPRSKLPKRIADSKIKRELEGMMKAEAETKGVNASEKVKRKAINFIEDLADQTIKKIKKTVQVKSQRDEAQNFLTNIADRATEQLQKKNVSKAKLEEIVKSTVKVSRKRKEPPLYVIPKGIKRREPGVIKPSVLKKDSPLNPFISLEEPEPTLPKKVKIIPFTRLEESEPTLPKKVKIIPFTRLEEPEPTLPKKVKIIPFTRLEEPEPTLPKKKTPTIKKSKTIETQTNFEEAIKIADDALKARPNALEYLADLNKASKKITSIIRKARKDKILRPVQIQIIEKKQASLNLAVEALKVGKVMAEARKEKAKDIEEATTELSQKVARGEITPEEEAKLFAKKMKEIEEKARRAVESQRKAEEAKNKKKAEDAEKVVKEIRKVKAQSAGDQAQETYERKKDDTERKEIRKAIDVELENAKKAREMVQKLQDKTEEEVFGEVDKKFALVEDKLKRSMAIRRVQGVITLNKFVNRLRKRFDNLETKRKRKDIEGADAKIALFNIINNEEVLNDLKKQMKEIEARRYLRDIVKELRPLVKKLEPKAPEKKKEKEKMTPEEVRINLIEKQEEIKDEIVRAKENSQKFKDQKEKAFKSQTQARTLKDLQEAQKKQKQIDIEYDKEKRERDKKLESIYNEFQDLLPLPEKPKLERQGSSEKRAELTQRISSLKEELERKSSLKRPEFEIPETLKRQSSAEKTIDTNKEAEVQKKLEKDRLKKIKKDQALSQEEEDASKQTLEKAKKVFEKKPSPRVRVKKSEQENLKKLKEEQGGLEELRKIAVNTEKLARENAEARENETKAQEFRRKKSGKKIAAFLLETKKRVDDKVAKIKMMADKMKASQEEADVAAKAMIEADKKEIEKIKEERIKERIKAAERGLQKSVPKARAEAKADAEKRAEANEKAKKMEQEQQDKADRLQEVKEQKAKEQKAKVNELIKEKYQSLTDEKNKYPKFSLEREFAKRYKSNFDKMLGEFKGRVLKLKDVEEIFKKAEPLFTEKEKADLKTYEAVKLKEQKNFEEQEAKLKEKRAQIKNKRTLVKFDELKKRSEKAIETATTNKEKIRLQLIRRNFMNEINESIKKDVYDNDMLEEQMENDYDQAEEEIYNDKDYIEAIKEQDKNEAEKKQQEEERIRLARLKEIKSKERAAAKAEAEARQKEKREAEAEAYAEQKAIEKAEEDAKAKDKAEKEAKAEEEARFKAEANKPPILKPELVKAKPVSLSRLSAQLDRPVSFEEPVKTEIKSGKTSVEKARERLKSPLKSPLKRQSPLKSERPSPYKLPIKEESSVKPRPKKESPEIPLSKTEKQILTELKPTITKMENLSEATKNTKEGNSTIIEQFDDAIKRADFDEVNRISKRAFYTEERKKTTAEIQEAQKEIQKLVSSKVEARAPTKSSIDEIEKAKASSKIENEAKAANYESRKAEQARAEQARAEQARAEQMKQKALNDQIKTLIRTAPKQSLISSAFGKKRPMDEIHRKMTSYDTSVLGKEEGGRSIAEAFNRAKEEGDEVKQKEIADRAYLLQTLLDTGSDI